MLWFVVTLPDSTTQEFQLPDRSKGQDLLDAVCEKLEIIEQDYFGLQYNGAKGEKLWLNRRNKICRQLTGSQPHRLRFRMKFFVQPHLLVQDSTKHYSFLTCKKDFEDSQLLATQDEEQLARIHALLLQATVGEFDRMSFSRHSSRLEWTQEFTHAVALQYSMLTDMKASSAQYKCLKEFSVLKNFGYEYHSVKTDENTISYIGVGGEGLRICDENFAVLTRVGYGALNKAWRDNRLFSLVVTDDDGSLCEYNLRLISPEACIQLFRSVTESHAFFGCETVNSTVKNQFTRDFKDSLISFFSEETSEKNYTFDVDRTVLEVHDHIRRVLYKQQQDASNLDPLPSTQEATHSAPETPNSENFGELKQKLDNIHQALLCKICMDATIDTVFCPCGHWVCCSECGQNIEKCPLCRTKITLHQKVYMDLPTILNCTNGQPDSVCSEEVSLK